MPSSLELAHCRPWWPSAVPHSISEATRRPLVDRQTALVVEDQAAEASSHSSSRVLYAGVFLSDVSRQSLCSRVQPQHSNQSADHVTLVFKPTPATVKQLPLGEVVSCLVTGVACSTDLQAVAVQLPDSLARFTPDAAHVTISVAEGRSKKDAGPFLQLAQASQGGGQYRPFALPWMITGTVGVRLVDGRTVLSSPNLPSSVPQHEDVPTPAASSAALGSQVEPSQPRQAVPGQLAAEQPASQAANLPPRAVYEGHPEGVERLQMQQAVQQALQLAPPALPSSQAAHKSGPCTSASPRPASAPLPIPQQGRAAHHASTALLAASPPQQGASEESSSSPVNSSDGSSPPQRPKVMLPAVSQQEFVTPQKQPLPLMLASDTAGLSFGAKLAAAWSGQLQASALQGLHDQAASTPGPQQCSLLLPKHKPGRQQAAQLAPHRAPQKGVNHPSHRRKTPLPAPHRATPPAQMPHSFLEPSSGSQKAASNAAFRAQLPPHTFPDLAWLSPPVGKPGAHASASWLQTTASGHTAMLSCSPDGPEQAQGQRQGPGSGLFHDSSNSSSSSDEGLTPEAARASAERSVRRREHLHRMADIERKAADMHTANAAVFGRAAREAYDQGETAVAKELGGRSRDSYQLAQDARAAANAAALNACNHSISNRFKVDLHGMHVEEALTVLDRHLVNLGGLGSPSGILLQVVTGVGKHSQGGQPRILPAIVRVLMASGLKFNHEPGNAGVIEVHLPGIPLDDSLHPGNA